MRTVANRTGEVEPRRTARQLLFIVILSATSFTACSNVSPTTAPASPTASATAPVSESPTLASATPVVATETPTIDGATPVASATPAIASPGRFDACALLTSAELSKILGAGAVHAKAMPAGGWVAGQCAWNGSASGFLMAVGTAASIAAAGDPAAPDAKAKLGAFRNAGTATDVPGIGDGAALGATGLAAYKGDIYFQITNLGLTDDQLLEIAKRVVANL